MQARPAALSMTHSEIMTLCGVRTEQLSVYLTTEFSKVLGKEKQGVGVTVGGSNNTSLTPKTHIPQILMLSLRLTKHNL